MLMGALNREMAPNRMLSLPPRFPVFTGTSLLHASKLADSVKSLRLARRLLHQLGARSVVAAVHMHDLAGGGGREVRDKDADHLGDRGAVGCVPAVRRPIGGLHPYLLLETMVVVRTDGRVRPTTIVMAIGVRSYGHREVLGADVAEELSVTFWLNFLKSLCRRGQTA